MAMATRIRWRGLKTRNSTHNVVTCCWMKLELSSSKIWNEENVNFKNRNLEISWWMRSRDTIVVCLSSWWEIIIRFILSSNLDTALRGLCFVSVWFKNFNLLCLCLYLSLSSWWDILGLFYRQISTLLSGACVSSQFDSRISIFYVYV